MERGNKNARVKKARVDEPLLLPVPANVKQEVAVVVQEPNGGGGGGAVVAAEVAPAGKEIDIKIDSAAFHCPVCSDRLRPPVFQCAAGLHTACSRCQSKLPGKRPLVRPGRRLRPVPRDHQHGCPSYVPYYEPRDHESVCPHAPCSCTEPGCAFVGSPRSLLAHLIDAHSWPVHTIRYGTHLGLGVRALEPRVLLVAAEEDEAVFLLAIGALGPARALSVVCVRANGEAGQQYVLELWAHASNERAIKLDCEVTSSSAPGEVAVGTVEFLTVPPAMMAGPQADKEMVITVCIDKSF
ncbi:hypothetical protein ACQJBY_068070 [Aegilops geniculata]